MSESADIIRRLVAGGSNYADIGRALGRDRSLIRQVGVGNKPGNNLQAALEALEAGRAVPEPARRRTAAQTLARVRRPVTTRGRSWSASRVKRQGVTGGARSLGHPIADAAGQGRQLAVTVTVNNSVSIEAYGTGRRGEAGSGGSADFKLGPAEREARRLVDDFDGDVTHYIAARMVEEGMVAVPTFYSGEAGDRDVIEHTRGGIVDIELRTFD